MSEFEFVAVLISIVMGLGIAQLLQGVAQAVHEQETAGLDSTHIAWTVATFLILVVNWWVLFQWRDEDLWSSALFLLLILWAVSLYLMVVFLYPPRKDPDQAWGEVFQANRRWFLSAFLAQCVLDIWMTGVRGDLFNPPAYFPFVGHYAVLLAIALAIGRPRFHRFLAWYFTVTLVVWILVARRLLT